MKPTHAELQQQVVDLLTATGWRWLHVRKSIGKGRKWTTATNVVGWPDLICWSVRQPCRTIAIEIKVPPDDLSVDQRRVLDELAAAGWECWVVRPADVDRLARALAAGMGRAGVLINDG